MVRPGAKNTFRRSIRNKKGEIVRKLEFPPGMPVDLTSKVELEAIYGDIGNALVIVERNDMGQAKPNWDATEEVIRERSGESSEVEVEESSGESADDEASGDESTTESADDENVGDELTTETTTDPQTSQA